MPPTTPPPPPPGPGEHSGLESAFKQYAAGRPDQAEATARRLQKRPETLLPATLFLARILMETGRSPMAVYELEELTTKHGDVFDVYMSLFDAYTGAREPERALAMADGLVAASPNPAETSVRIAALCMAEGQLGDAERRYQAALSMQRGSIAAVMGLARVYMATFRAREAMAMVQAAIDVGVNSTNVLRFRAFYGQYVSGEDPAELFQRQKLVGMMTVGEVQGTPPTLKLDASPDRKLTIGFLSPDFRQHACAHFIEPLLEHMDRSAFRLVAYSNTIHSDAVTERLKRHVDAWRDVAAINDPALVQQIVADKVDIAIDLAGHTIGNRLKALALHPAKITATYLGYPASTGMPGIDWRIVDSITDPEGAGEAFASERLARVGLCFVCYRPLAASPAVEPSPMLKAGHVTFGSFNAIEKISEGAIEAWSRLLHRVPGSTLLLKGRAFGDPSVAERAVAAFAAHGIDRSRLELIGWAPTLQEHLDVYRRVDIALDTFPYNGTTTTCEALWMGVPVVTLRGKLHAGRVGASLLSAVGLPELVGEDVNGFVEVAAALASDSARLESLRSGMRDRMAVSPLRDEKKFAGAFGSMLRRLWREAVGVSDAAGGAVR